VSLLGLGGRDVADGLEQAARVVPVDPFERGELDLLEAAPRPASADDLGLEEAVDRLGEGFVVAVADGEAGRAARVAMEGSIPASARRSVYRIETYWTPRSL
jgi:hypothetical protein